MSLQKSNTRALRGHTIRLALVLCFFLVLLAVLWFRMLDLMVLHRQFLQGQGDARSVRVIQTPAYRGLITDRNAIPLAVTTSVPSIVVNPKSFHAKKKQYQALEEILNLPVGQLKKQIHAMHQKEFLYIKRQIPPSLAEKVAALDIPGIIFQTEYKRYYPEGDSTAQLVGFTNIDDQGIEGMELAYQDWLKGTPGRKKVLKDRMGREIEELAVLSPPHPGHDLVLSIDRRIQFLAYDALKDTLEKFKAKSGSVVVIDTETGEILAIVNAPSFNPNVRAAYGKDTYRNKSITDTFEPGSVIKPFSIASALETGNFTPDTVIDTRPSWMTVQGHTIRDVHDYGVLTVTGVLEHSSNVGVTKMVLTSPPEQLIGLLLRSGFGQRTESNYPGESDGGVVRVKEANPFVLATLGFGYHLSVTALQLAKAYTIFANHGALLPISLIHTDNVPTKTQVISPKVSDDVLHMMESVMENGTGRSARIPGYRVAGKTGTARVAGKKGYAENRHIASFVGIAPVTHPKLVVVVIVQEPTHLGYYGAAVAAPLFAQVMSGALRVLNVPPDKS
ncbi:MAG: penicillin-binding transpeptidase domain-containing protein [Legionellaceae bacterium]|nr:penicillin-binding transpeptidase domain-containing protein [Legionellaceae bacterium]